MPNLFHPLKRFVLFHGKRHPDEMGEPEINTFLTHLAVKERVSALVVGLLLLGCAPSAGPRGSGPQPSYAFVTRSEAVNPQTSAPASRISYLLQSLEDSTLWVRFDFFRSEADARRSGNGIYRLVLRVPGVAQLPTHAVYAEWQLEHSYAAPQFEQSRADLFALRAEHLESFHADLLLQSVAEPVRYLILGLYASEEGLRQARAHPSLRAFAEQNPPSRFGVRDLYGVRYFRIAPR